MGIAFPDSKSAGVAAQDTERAALCWQRWSEALERLPQDERQAIDAALPSGGQPDLLSLIFAHSPFLSDCAIGLPEEAARLCSVGPGPLWDEVRARLESAAPAGQSETELIKSLRQERKRVALIAATADITGHWGLLEITGILSRFAELATDRAVAFLLRGLHDRGEMLLADPDQPLQGCGYTVLGLGKLGARELNYSSDIDLIVFFDPERIDYRGRRGLQDTANRLTRDLIRLLEERTADGYVCRTDLRLRPDPAAMPVAISYPAAMAYYESAGQNWERAAMIKARPVAGDRELGAEFLRELRPFIWRKHLDFWAIQDIHSIKRQIHAQKGSGTIAVEGHNIKLGRGGIREIEFFAQTQQLIFGGRNPTLREPQTMAALDALVAAGRTPQETAERLKDAYVFLRTLEHRLQMVADQQTHSLPKDAEGIAEIARFLLFDSEEAFRRRLVEVLSCVQHHYAELFEEAPTLAGPGNLVFTGGEPEPGTLETLGTMGFQDGTRVFNLVRAWHHGRYRATRSERSRQILTELMPALLGALGKTREPDRALTKFDEFLGRLPAGVQLFSMLQQNPRLLELLAEVVGTAPALADQLSRRPGLLEYVLEGDVFASLPDIGALQAELETMLQQARDYQDTLDSVRRWAGDRRFQVGAQVLRGETEIEEIERAFSDIADVSVAALLPPTLEELSNAHGRFAGAGLAVVALGKLGARQMTPSSDLDLVFLYDSEDGAGWSDGDKPLDPTVYFGRLSQRLITAITAQTGEGSLYEVDARLRPSGNSGPIAVTLKSFRDYYDKDAWVWEHMALTRARPIAGEPAFCQQVSATISHILRQPRDSTAVLSAARKMRERIEAEHPARSIWQVKYARGGLYDLDFIAQSLQLVHAHAHPEVLAHSTAEALKRLGEAGLITATAAEALAKADRLYRQVQTFLRLTAGQHFDEEAAPAALKQDLTRAAGLDDFQHLKEHLAAVQEAAYGLYGDLLGGDSTGAEDREG